MHLLYACLYIPDFPAAALLRGEHNPPATAVTTGKAPNRFVYSANKNARAGGVSSSMPLAEAETRYSRNSGDELRVIERNAQAETRAQQDLVELALTISPRVEDSAPGLLVLDLAGLPNTHASATELAYGVEKLGFEANIGVSRNRFVASIAAHCEPGVTHIFPGQESGFLETRPLSVLPLEQREREVFARWGFFTIRDLLKVSEDDLVERFGERGSSIAKLARGEAVTIFHAHEAPIEFEESQDLDWQISELEPLSFLLTTLLESLCFKLQGHNVAAASVRVALKLANGSRYERKIDLSYPLRDSSTLLTLLRIDLAAHPPGDAVEGIAISAAPTEQRMMQFALFSPDAPRPETLAVTLARLENLVGPKRVGSPVVPNTHKPGAHDITKFGKQIVSTKKAQKRKLTTSAKQIPSTPLKTFAGARHAGGFRGMEPKPEAVPVPRLVPVAATHRAEPATHRPHRKPTLVAGSGTAQLTRGKLIFRSFRPAIKAEVILRGTTPVYVDSPLVSAAIEKRSGPWHVRGDWWTEEQWDYEEWDITADGRQLRLCLEKPANVWRLTGLYD